MGHHQVSIMTWFSSRVSINSSEVFSSVLPVRWVIKIYVGEVPILYLVRLVVELKSLPTDFQVFDHLLHGKLFAGFVNNVVNL